MRLIAASFAFKVAADAPRSCLLVFPCQVSCLLNPASTLIALDAIPMDEDLRRGEDAAQTSGDKK